MRRWTVMLIPLGTWCLSHRALPTILIQNKRQGWIAIFLHQLHLSLVFIFMTNQATAQLSEATSPTPPPQTPRDG